MVAKSFQNLEIVGEVYVSKGKQYVQVRTKSGGLRQVRWYTEKEYAKMYPEENKIKEFKTQKEVLGFTKGYITIFKGDIPFEDDYFKLSAKISYARGWGWYIPSTEEIPEDLPEYAIPVRLPWELVGKEDETLKTDREIAAAVEPLRYESDESEYQGQIGDKLELIVVVEKAIALDGYYGLSTMHIMRDYDGNCYVWTTAARSWEIDSEHHIIGSVKDHKQYKGVRQTVLTRCREVRD